MDPNTATAGDVVTGPGAVDDEHHGHPSDATYVKIFLALFVLTAIEVAWLYIGLPSWALIGGLFAMMSVKFYLICAFFMHLKLDIRLFTQLFVAGLILATTVYVIMLSSQHFWDGF